MNTQSPDKSHLIRPFGTAEVITKVCDAAFGKPLVTNVLRGQVVEAMIALALEPVWTWCSADYASWDFERADGVRLEVKQSAARQSWSTDKPSKSIFDIAARTGRYEAHGWVEEYGRAAHIYVFAHHPIFDETADHRDPAQWLFYVVPTKALPDVKQIALGTIKTMAEAVLITALAEKVTAIASTIPSPRTASEDRMKTIREDVIGKYTLRLVDTGKGIAGLLNSGGKQLDRIHGTDASEVWAQLRAVVGKASDTYFGFEGARARFLQFFPYGFRSPAFEGDERGSFGERRYKLRAKAKLDEAAPLAQALIGTGYGEAALAAYRATNLLSPFEKTRLDQLLRGPDADAFIQAAAQFAMGDVASVLNAMERILAKYDSAKWTVVTYLPFLWRPEEHMFLKPMVTQNFAERVGHTFYYDYSPTLDPDVYASLLDLMAVTKAELADLRPRDNIDLQSFIWTVGEYKDGDQALIAENTFD